MKRLVLVTMLLTMLTPVFASDHADPIGIKIPESGITGLFAWPEGNNLVVVLAVRPGLTTNPPYDLEPYTYRLMIDTDSIVSFDDAGNLARYGGSIADPSAIQENITIDINLNNDATVANQMMNGLPENSGFRLWTGVRDDPFIFPKFFGTNVVAMVMHIPRTHLSNNILLWATTHKGSKQIDHVGRSNRTMQPRFDALNTAHPSKHVQILHEQHDHPGIVGDIARTEIMPLFALRPYDYFPDVMIFSSQRAAGFPNGRRLSDDVAALTCQQGDCLLWELSYALSAAYPRKTSNDKAFLNSTPYLAEAWPSRAPDPEGGLTTRTKILLALFATVLVILLLLPWVLLHRCKKERRP